MVEVVSRFLDIFRDYISDCTIRPIPSRVIDNEPSIDPLRMRGPSRFSRLLWSETDREVEIEDG